MGIRTIIVDDEELARERVRRLLVDQEEIEIVAEASNGLEAVEKIKALQPDLVFLDIEMPGFNGFKVVQSLDCPPLPKIIFVTAYNQYAVDAFEVGAVDYLLKPVKKGRLLAAITRAQATLHAPGHDLLAAHNVQKRLLPDKDLQLGNVEVSGTCLAANEVGGDYYDFIPLSPARLAICLADISGKGFPAALMMANLQAMLRILSKEHGQPAEVIAAANKSFYENSIAEMYATLFYGVYDASRRSFTFCNAGHNPPLFFHDRRLRRLDCGGTVVGMFSDSTYEQETILVGPDDVLVMYSDGLTDLANDAGEDFGEPRLARLLEDHLQLSAAALKDLIVGRAQAFSNGVARQDDLTVVVITSL